MLRILTLSNLLEPYLAEPKYSVKIVSVILQQKPTGSFDARKVP